MDAPTAEQQLDALRTRDRRLLYWAGGVVNVSGVLSAALLEFEPQFAAALAVVAAVGVPASWVFRRWGFRRLPVNAAIVLVSASTLVVYLYRSPWFPLLSGGNVGRALLGASTVYAYSLLIHAIAVLTAFRTFGLLGDRDVVLSLIPSGCILTLVAVLRPRSEVLPFFVLFAGGALLSVLLERRLQHLSLENQLGTERARRRSLPLSLRILTILVCLAALGAYGLAEVFGQYQPRYAWIDRYGIELARYVADWMTAASRVSHVGTDSYLDLSTSRGSFGNAPLFEVRARQAACWRTGTLDRYNGTTWRSTRSHPRKFALPPEGLWLGRGERDGRLLKQTVTARAPLVMALPCAFRAVWVRGRFSRVRLSEDGQLSCSQVVPEGESYTVVSCLDGAAGRDRRLSKQDRFRYLALPMLPSEVSDFARQATRAGTDAEDKAQRLADLIGSRCRYTLRPGFLPDGKEAVSYFLFESRRGYCVHFASAMAVCLRTLGIPSRVATGFAPGTFDDARRVFAVRERDAHAWVEAWLPGKGWTTFDATASARPMQGERKPLFARLREAVAAGLARLRRRPGESWAVDWCIVGICAGACATGGLALLAAARAHRARKRRRPSGQAWTPAAGASQTLALSYEHAASLLARRLAAREDAQTPHEYARAVARQSPATGGPFAELTDLYAECRYSSHLADEVQSQTASRLLAEVRGAVRRSRAA